MRRPGWTYACWLGLHRWRLYSITDTVWPQHKGRYRQRCSRCRRMRLH